jgi:hypothetical protein
MELVHRLEHFVRRRLAGQHEDRGLSRLNTVADLLDELVVDAIIRELRSDRAGRGADGQP